MARPTATSAAPGCARIGTASPRQPRGRHLAPPLAASSRVAEDFVCGRRRVELIVSDVDGTLLDPRQRLAPGVRAALQAADEAGVPLVLATGKAKGPWLEGVVPHVGNHLPQIFLQGLLVSCPQQGTLYERLLEEQVILEAIEFADVHGLTLTAYCGERIVCRQTNEQSDRLLFYREPTPEGIGPLAPHVGRLPIMKLLLMQSEQRIAEIRPVAEQQFAGRASLTTAIPGMLEILPLGSSKGAGVAWLLHRLGVDPANVLALGDGENDVEMLRLCGLGVAMGNAGPPALAAADAVTASNADDGVARAVERFVLQPRGLAPPAAAAASGPA